MRESDINEINTSGNQHVDPANNGAGAGLADNLSSNPANNGAGAGLADNLSNNPARIRKVSDIDEIKDIGLTGSYEEQANMMQDIYDNLDTPEEKLEFLVNSQKYLYMTSVYESGNYRFEGLSTVLRNKIDSLRDDFENNYIKNAYEEDLSSYLDKCNEMSVKNKAKISYEYKKYLKQIPENDKNREKKALYLARTNPENGTSSTSITDMEGCVRSEYDSSKLVLKDIDLKSNTKMSDIAGIIGCTDEKEKKDFYKRYDAEAGDNAIETFRKKYVKDALKLNNNGENDENAIEKYKKSFNGKTKGVNTSAGTVLREKKYYHALHTQNNYVKNLFFNEEQKKDFTFIVEETTQELSTGGIKDWIKTKGEEIFEARRKSDLISFVNYYDKKYVKSLQRKKDYINLERESKNRIKKATSDSYDWVVEDWYDDNGNRAIQTGSDQQIKEFKYDIRADLKAEIVDERELETFHFNDSSLKEGAEQVDKNSRETTILSVFQIWALGTHENIKVSDIKNLTDNQALLDEFSDYCKAHPTCGAKDKETYEESIKSWCDLFEKATDKIKKYKIPKVNYDNEEELKTVLSEIQYVCVLLQDFSQEIPTIFKEKFNVDGKIIAENYMGEDKWNSMRNTLIRAGNFLSLPYDAYFKDYIFETGGTAFSSAFSMATDRVLANELLNKNAGKSFETITKNYGDGNETHPYVAMFSQETVDGDGDITKTYAELYNGWSEFKKKDPIKYLNGKDKKTFKKKIKKYVSVLEEKGRKAIEKDCIDNLSYGFLKDLKMDILKDSLSNLSDNPDDVVNFLKSDQLLNNAGLTNMSLIGNVMNKMFNESYRCLINTVGLTTNDLFTIDGKTFKELWGDKYKNVTDESLRNRCYQVEMLKKIAEGNCEVRVKLLGFDKNNKLGIKGDMIVHAQPERIRKIKHNMDIYNAGVNDILRQLKDVQGNLLNTHPDFDSKDIKDLREEIGTVGTKLFQNFEKELNETIKVLGSNNSDINNPKNIKEQLNKLSVAANTYYSKRRNYVFKKQNEAGQERFDASKRTKTLVNDIVRNISILRQGIDENIICAPGSSFEDASVVNIGITLKNLEDPEIDIYGIKDVKTPEEDEGATLYNYRVTIGNKLVEKFKNIDKDFNKIINDDGKLEPYDAALAYYAKEYIDKVQEIGMNDDKFASINQKLENAFNDGSFKKDAERLSKSPVFKEFLKKNKKFDYRTWKNHEKECSALLATYKNDLESITKRDEIEVAGNMPRFRANPDLGVADAGAGAVNAEAGAANAEAGANNAVAADPNAIAKYILTGDAHGKVVPDKEMTVEKRYERLGNYMSKKILTEKASKSMIDAMVEGKLEYEDVLKTVVDALKQNKIFKKGQYNEQKLSEMIQNGDLRKMVIDSVVKQAQNSAKNVKVAAQKDLAQPKLPNTNAQPAKQQGPGMHA
ncbi:MAG: hypothetical protein K6G11_08525 [Lachnospiraceae bacterium]|nr:hypothetical protein [Lachnospiraceae bacterium]